MDVWTFMFEEQTACRILCLLIDIPKVKNQVLKLLHSVMDNCYHLLVSASANMLHGFCSTEVFELFHYSSNLNCFSYFIAIETEKEKEIGQTPQAMSVYFEIAHIYRKHFLICTLLELHYIRNDWRWTVYSVLQSRMNFLIIHWFRVSYSMRLAAGATEDFFSAFFVRSFGFNQTRPITSDMLFVFSSLSTASEGNSVWSQLFFCCMEWWRKQMPKEARMINLCGDTASSVTQTLQSMIMLDRLEINETGKLIGN